ncbi:nickel-dependent hydrogenase large subunit [Rhodoblastus acidophilus]|uniref:Nickel-dependent hydrogenase large subunit n=1 Tax=Candidatus Rhodoblastus alkanivorans TaxID=2954117 RepID=A0ABS9Z395_9HYPH|nr:nickel-dependent hydrogenase large subunit [Candidatus Rhodoblastus alkanivorans]MCI4677441.1 nickel-dependent hydrogenase large subunit [Candidatus Rhodoblastus alkanivorans]MCI4681800.1 nickel-dependent hydrogenase large subunit [Candidatus Rhodoblastus alkanivorans]MDI4642850.1 nickel-dependent hydrogenase large subunit [Rhodoblastus acidophilus]
MTRLVVGPFNRVEGDLELTLDIADGRVAEARVATTLYRGFEQILVGRPAADALAIAPRICGICSLSQSMAAAAALRAVSGVQPPPNGEMAANIAHAAENIADHLTHFYLFFMPDFCRAFYADAAWFAGVEARFKALSGAAAAEVLPARARLLHIMGLIAGKWPHSLAIQPGGVTRSLELGEKMRLIAILGDFRAFLEKVLFGAPLEQVVAIATPEQMADFAEGRGDFAAFLRLARDLGLAELGAIALPLISFGAYHGAQGALFPAGLFDPRAGAAGPLPFGAIGEDVAFSYLRDSAADPARAVTLPDAERQNAYSWAKAPRLASEPAETGAVARQAVAGDPLIRALIARGRGTNVFARVVARVIEIARLTLAAEAWARALRLRESFCAHGPAPAAGAGVGMVEAARGALGHWLSVDRGLIQRYQIVAPTTWNFSPRDAQGVPGPLEQALVGVEVGDAGAKAPAIQHVVRSFDPCMVCTAH